MSVLWSKQNLDGFTHEEHLNCVLNVRMFWSFAKRLYIDFVRVGERERSDSLFEFTIQALTICLLQVSCDRTS